MDQQDHMINMVSFLSVNFCPWKIWYQVEILWDQRKANKECLSTLRFFELKIKIYYKYTSFIIIKIQDLQTFLIVFSLLPQIVDLISYIVWAKVYRQTNHHIDHMVWLFHGLKYIILIKNLFPEKIICDLLQSNRFFLNLVRSSKKKSWGKN